MLVSGVDDGYFPLYYKGGKGYTVLLSVVYEEYKILDVDFGFIKVDGNDASRVLNSLNTGDICILDGVTFGGFNYIDPKVLTKKFIIFYSSKPNLVKVEEALKKHFTEERRQIIMSVLNSLVRISTIKGDIYIYTNMDMKVAKEIIEKYQIFDKIPEPLKNAHEISSSLSTFLLSKRII